RSSAVRDRLRQRLAARAVGTDRDRPARRLGIPHGRGRRAVRARRRGVRALDRAGARAGVRPSPGAALDASTAPCGGPGRGHDLVSVSAQTGQRFLATLPSMAKTSTTPWGAASVVDEVNVQQRAGEKRFASVVQLLEAGGERLIRFSYTTGGAARRGPVTLRARDLERLRADLGKHPELAAFLGLSASGGSAANRKEGA